MIFQALHIEGFKSFARPVSISIHAGLTGLVGPNGCGKSNIVEALRWVMGETSAKRIRGQGMDDIIFAGTKDRAPRNQALVRLVLGNPHRRAPKPYHNEDTIEIVRSARRGEGSSYTINGREVRARDVQTFFADLICGPRSTTIISQGQVEAMVTAKPHDHRLLLEEAAGIRGLQSRRHESELKLKAAHENLQRLDDVFATMTARKSALASQARRARRYTKISDRIRATEAMHTHQQWHTLQEQLLRITSEADIATRAVATDTVEASALNQKIQSAEAELRTLEHAVVEADTALRTATRRIHEHEQEQWRAQERRESLGTRIEAAMQECLRTRQQGASIEETLSGLEAERTQLATPVDAQPLRDKVRAQSQHTQELEDTAEALATELASLNHQRQEHASRAALLTEQIQHWEEDIAQNSTDKPDDFEATEAALAAAEAQQIEALETLAALEKEAQAHHRARLEAHEAHKQALASAQQKLRHSEGVCARINDEKTMLESTCKTMEAQRHIPVLQSTELVIPPQWEAAVTAALGRDIFASLEAEAPHLWQQPEPTPAPPRWPEGVTPLNALISAPAVMQARLSHIGVFEGTLPPCPLQPGQCLVNKDGVLWQWDGIRLDTRATEDHSHKLAQQYRQNLNRLEALRQQWPEAERQHQACLAAVQDLERNAECDFEPLELCCAQANLAVEEQQQVLATLQQDTEQARARMAQARTAMQETLNRQAMVQRHTQSIASNRQILDTLEQTLAELQDPAPLTERLHQQRAEAAQAREQLTALQGQLTALEEKQSYQHERSQHLEEQYTQWTRRRQENLDHIAALEQQQSALEAENATLPAGEKTLPPDLKEALEAAEANRINASERLDQHKNTLRTLRSQLQSAEQRLADVRIEQARFEERTQQTETAIEQTIQTCLERFERHPKDLSALFESLPDDSTPEALEEHLRSLRQQRERMGAINLQADEELGALEEHMTSLQAEYTDLSEAIASLRRSIQVLNAESRERLEGAFESVNAHFGQLFATLFEGGEAHLELTDDGDEDARGLEVFARPPGKRRQTLSLMSGGEKSLTALALVFAVFLTNPAPICVLDEVDAALDETNTHRFCTLLESLKSEDTRFIIVTHHRLTMTRMDRLWGVSMLTPGVSSLLAVDLEEAQHAYAS